MRIPRVWPAAMLDHPSRAAEEHAWIVMCPCRYYRPVWTGDDLDEAEAYADGHGVPAEPES